MKIEDKKVARPAKLDTRSKSTKKDLPAGCQDGNLYRGCFITTYLKFIGQYANPWSIDDTDAVNAMKKIWKVVYRKKIEHVVEFGDKVFMNVSTYCIYGLG